MVMTMYITKKGLYVLKNNLKNYDTMLYLKLRDYIHNLKEYYGDFDGEFLFNIFDKEELNKINSNYDLFNGVNYIYYEVI